MKRKFNIGEYVLIEGQIAEILDVRLDGNFDIDWYEYKVKLCVGGPTTWINEIHLSLIENQQTPKVLYGR